MFARFGIPEVLVSDNGPQFVSEEMARFLLSMGVEHMYSAPYHPQSNGEAKRSVQTFKSAMKSMKGGEGTLSQKLSSFLFQYRNTPNVTTGITPSELFLGRRVCTRLSLLAPDIAARVQKKQAQSSYSGVNRNFEVGDPVWAKAYGKGQGWEEGLVTKKQGGADYEVLVDKQLWRRHADQLKKRMKEKMQVVPEPAAPSESAFSENAPVESSLDKTVSPSESVSGFATSGNSTSSTETPSSEITHEETLPQDTPVSPRRNPPRERRPPQRLDL